MTDSIALKLNRKGDLTEVEIRVPHPMEAGDDLPPKSGKPRAPLFLQSIVIQLNGKSLLDGQLSASLSRNPSFTFSFAGVKSGDRFTVYCMDNKGSEFKGEAVAQ